MKYSPDVPTPSPRSYPPLPIIYEEQTVTWEYRQLIRNLTKEAAPTAEELNMWGAEGWELVGLFSDSPVFYFYFKRPAKTQPHRAGGRSPARE
jgi:hypothetical protein